MRLAVRGGLVGLLVLAALVAGCSGPLRTAPAGQDWVTESDEPAARKRARTRVELAAGYFEQGQLTVALDEVKQAIQIDPSYAAAFNLRGLIYTALRDLRLAEDSFQQALRLDPRDGDAWHNLGWMYCQDGRYPASSDAFQRALQAPGYRAPARTWLAWGVCQARAGQSAEAERALQRAFELDPGNPITMYNLALLLWQRGDLTRAQFYARRLNNSELANAESLWLGVKIERRLGNREAAAQLAEQLRRRFAGSREAAALERGAFDE
ncbi:MAG: type IV pilus biogenesis/stability protein PilW [Tepidimonas sp.]|uniref:type IV pilus biogenesis/stability protein PilW n=1 Tax=Tepidimonas sp. TaxID=2002775 RepID=UPI00298EF2F9|nr:type IV pilus biogenesis/stability protein PilW [Tepidimonas sp.]MCS6811733.1 type IV pilus biogenesis/stability protein PilW [Tepidimonas sp.]MDW8336914.1 type IV pilus biogenesis/stability protein PilW [Tepidimonas sp.]